MAWYDMNKEVKELAELKGITMAEVAAGREKFEFMEDDGKDGTYYATNRWSQSKLINELLDFKMAKEERENREKARSNFHWVKIDYDWLVKGDFTDVKKGDEIEVFKVNGTSQKKTVQFFTEDGFAKVY